MKRLLSQIIVAALGLWLAVLYVPGVVNFKLSVLAFEPNQEEGSALLKVLPKVCPVPSVNPVAGRMVHTNEPPEHSPAVETDL